MTDYSMLPPHVQAQATYADVPWEPQGEIWNGDPGIYAEPDPSWGGDPGIVAAPDPGFAGDPGIYADPPTPGTLVEGPPRYHAPSIVPGLDWMVERSREARVETAPATAPTSGTPATDGVAEMTLGDHVGGGAKGFLLPSLLGGAFSGIMAAMAVKSAGHGAGLAAGAGGARMVASTLGGVATGAAAGLLVAATSPDSGDSLAARYAVAGGLIGAAGGAAFPGGPSRALGAVLGGISGAVVAGFTGANLQKQHGG